MSDTGAVSPGKPAATPPDQRSYLIAHDFAVAVPDGPEDDPAALRAEDEAMIASPAFQARVEAARENMRAGRGIPSEALYAEFGHEPTG